MEQKEWRFVKKKDWGEGPWLNEPDKIQWEDKATGLPCLIVRNGGVTGALCGYVGVAPGHPWFGIDYGDIEEISVHGGLTFSDACQKDNKDYGVCHVAEDGIERWWIGFDCAHAYDLSPALDAQLKDFRRLRGRPSHNSYEVYRDVEYVKGQCAELARQVKERGDQPARLITLED